MSRKHVSILFLMGVLLFSRCSGQHDIEPLDEPDATVDVGFGTTVTIEGTVVCLTPLDQVEIKVVEMHQLSVGSVLAETMTDSDGRFSADVQLSGASVIMVRADIGGSMQEGPGGSFALPVDATMSSLVVVDPAHASHVELAVTPWTTLAEHLAIAYEAQGQGSMEAVSLAVSRLGDHLWRPASASLSSIIPTNPLDASSPEVTPASIAGLATAGLFMLADDGGFDSPWVALQILADDLDDGLFDGSSPDGPLVVDGIPMDSYVTRTYLAQAIAGFVSARSEYPITLDSLAITGGLFDDLCKDDGPLYPTDAPPIPFVIETATLVFEPPTPDADTYHKEVFTVRVAIVGGGQATSMDVITPEGLAPSMVDGASLELTINPEEIADGPVTVAISASLEDGTTQEVSRSFFLDSTAPVVTVTSHLEELQYVNQTNQVIVGTVDEPGSGLEDVQVSLDGLSWTPVDSLQDGQWGHTVALPTGQSTVLVRATDLLGSTSEALQIPFIVDTSLPVVVVGSATPDEGACLSEPFTVQATASDDNGVLTIEIIGPSVGQVVEGSVLDVQLDPLSLTDGETTITIRATDMAGNQGTASRTIFIDTGEPSVVIDSPISGSFVGSTSTEVAGRAFDAGCGATVVTIASGTGEPVTTAEVSGEGEWTALLPTTAATNLFVVTATDAAGQVSLPVSYSLLLDMTPPALSWVEPMPDEGACLALGAAYTFALEAVDASGIDSLDIASPLVGATLEQIDISSWTLTVDTSQLAEGPLEVTVEGYDSTGHSSYVTRSFILDGTPPEVVVTSPDDGIYTNATSTVVAGQWSDQGCGALTSMEVTLGGSTYDVTVDGGQWQSDDVYLPDAPPGGAVAQMSIKAVDGAGLETTESISITVDHVPPTVTLQPMTLPGPSGFYNDSFMLQALASDDSGEPATVELTSHDLSLVTMQPNYLSAFVELDEIGDGAHTVEVVATDLAGNSGSATSTISIDTTPPVITFTSPAWSPFYTELFEITVEGTIHDDGSGVDSLSMVIPTPETPVYIDGDGAFIIENMPISLMANSFQFEMTDSAGNVGIETLEVFCDKDAPTITMDSSSYYDERTFIVDIDPVEMTFELVQGLGTKVIQIEPFDQPGDLYKYSNRLSEETSASPGFTLPPLYFTVEDSEDNVDEVWFSFSINGEAMETPVSLLDKQSDEQYSMFISTDYLGESLASCLPDDLLEIEVFVSDKAGHVDSFSYSFYMNLIAPPLHMETLEQDSDDPDYLAHYSLEDCTLHEIFEKSTVILFQKRITNVHDVPVFVQPTSGASYVMYGSSQSRAHVTMQSLPAAPCSEASCNYSMASTGETGCIPYQYHDGEATADPVTTGNVYSVLKTEEGALIDQSSPGWYEIPAKTSIIQEFRATVSSSDYITSSAKLSLGYPTCAYVTDLETIQDVASCNLLSEDPAAYWYPMAITTFYLRGTSSGAIYSGLVVRPHTVELPTDWLSFQDPFDHVDVLK